jgi:hypothetical protein
MYRSATLAIEVSSTCVKVAIEITAPVFGLSWKADRAQCPAGPARGAVLVQALWGRGVRLAVHQLTLRNCG